MVLLLIEEMEHACLDACRSASLPGMGREGADITQGHI